jgi:adenylate kinase
VELCVKVGSFLLQVVVCGVLLLSGHAFAADEAAKQSQPPAGNTHMPKPTSKEKNKKPIKLVAAVVPKRAPAAPRKKPVVVVLMGAPGSGKGTQAAILSKKMDIPHISTGDLLRAEVAKGSELGKEASAIMKKGELVPDGLVLDMLKKRVAARDCNKGFLLDGFPRTEVQANMFDMAIGNTKHVIVINIDVADDVITTRILGRAKDAGDKKRADDNPAAIKERLAQYHQNSEPLIAMYQKRNLLSHIDGTGDVQSIHQNIWKEVQRRLATLA